MELDEHHQRQQEHGKLGIDEPRQSRKIGILDSRNDHMASQL